MDETLGYNNTLIRNKYPWKYPVCAKARTGVTELYRDCACQCEQVLLSGADGDPTDLSPSRSDCACHNVHCGRYLVTLVGELRMEYGSKELVCVDVCVGCNFQTHTNSTKRNQLQFIFEPIGICGRVYPDSSLVVSYSSSTLVYSKGTSRVFWTKPWGTTIH